MAAMNTADIGFEKEIWKAADKMRGNIDASEYKSVVLGLIFLKYISDKFEAKYQQLVAEGEGFEEDKDEYLSNKMRRVVMIRFSMFLRKPVGKLLPSMHTLLKLERSSTMRCGQLRRRISV